MTDFNLLAALKSQGEYAVEHDGKETWDGDKFAELLIDGVLAQSKLEYYWISSQVGYIPGSFYK